MTSFKKPEQSIPRSPGHYQEWVDACKGGQPAGCNFDYAGPLTEIVLLGNAAVRSGRKLFWDPLKMSFTNDSEANQYLQEPYHNDWEL